MKPVDTREQFFAVWDVYWPIALAVFVAIAAAIVVLVVRYRSREREFPGGKDENEPLETGYAIALACVAAFLVYLTFSHMPGGEDAAASGPPIAVDVTAARWNWRFEYPTAGVVEQGTRDHVPVLRVPVDTEIDFTGSSIDVIHSFWIPEQRFKRDLFPTFANHWEMVFGEVVNSPAGGLCAEFCGLEHSNMAFDVLVMPKAEFAAWLRSAGGGA